MSYENLLILCENKKMNTKTINYYLKYEEKIDLHKNDNELFKYLISKNKLSLFKFFYKMTNYNDFEFNILDKFNDIYERESLLCYLCRYNYVEFIKYICEKESILDFYEKYNEPLILSCQENNLNVVKYIYKYYDKLDIFSDEVILNYSIFKKNYKITEWYLDALYKSDIDENIKKEQLNYIIINLCTYDTVLFRKILKKYKIDKDDEILEICLCENNSKNIKLYLLNNYDFNDEVIGRCYYSILKIKDTDLIKRLDELNYDYETIDWNLLFMLSLSNNNIAVCEYIYKLQLGEHINGLLNLFNMSVMFFCKNLCMCKNLSFDGLKYIFNILEKKIEIDKIIKHNMVAYFCAFNKLKEAKNIYEKCKNKKIEYDELDIELEMILFSCNLKTIKWALNIFNKTLDDIDMDEDVILDIIYNINEKKMNKKESLKLMRFLMYRKDMIKLYEIDNFISLNNINVMKLLTKHKDFRTKETLFNICKYCDKEILEWYLGKSSIYCIDDLYLCLKLCCKHGNYNGFMYLNKLYKLDNMIYENIDELLNKSCMSNNLKIVFMLEKYLTKKIIIKDCSKLLNKNNFNLIRFILDNSNIDVNKNSLLKYSLKNGNIEAVRLLINCLDEKNIKKVIHLYEGSLLKTLFYNKYLDMLILIDKYLNIEILDKLKNNSLLEFLLEDEYIELLKYINKKIDLKKIINDDILKNICKKKKLLSVKYLLEINDNYNYIIKSDSNDIIPIIKNSVEYYYENKEYDKLIEHYKINIIKDLEKKDDCLICYQNSGVLITKCKHNYCMDCILKWYIYTKQECPYCRSELNLSDSNIIQHF